MRVRGGSLQHRDLRFIFLGFAASLVVLWCTQIELLSLGDIQYSPTAPPSPSLPNSFPPNENEEVYPQFLFLSASPSSVSGQHIVQLLFYTYVYNANSSYVVSLAPFGEKAGDMPWILRDLVKSSCVSGEQYAECAPPATINWHNKNQNQTYIDVPFQFTVQAPGTYQLVGAFREGSGGNALATLQISEDGSVDLRKEEEWTHGLLTTNNLRIVVPENATSSVNASRFRVDFHANTTLRVGYETSKICTWFKSQRGHKGEFFTDFKVTGGNGNLTYNIPFSMDVEPDVKYSLHSVIWTPYGRDRIDSVTFKVLSFKNHTNQVVGHVMLEV